MKKSIKTMFAGLLAIPVLLLGSSLFVPAIQTQPVSAAADDGIQDGADSAATEDQQTELFGDDGIFKIITNAALFVIGAVSVLMLIYGGIRYTISVGDTAAVTAAKNTILYAIVGIVVALLAAAIVNFVLEKLIAA